MGCWATQVPFGICTAFSTASGAVGTASGNIKRTAPVAQPALPCATRTVRQQSRQHAAAGWSTVERSGTRKQEGQGSNVTSPTSNQRGDCRGMAREEQRLASAAAAVGITQPGGHPTGCAFCKVCLPAHRCSSAKRLAFCRLEGGRAGAAWPPAVAPGARCAATMHCKPWGAQRGQESRDQAPAAPPAAAASPGPVQLRQAKSIARSVYPMQEEAVVPLRCQRMQHSRQVLCVQPLVGALVLCANAASVYGNSTPPPSCSGHPDGWLDCSTDPDELLAK